MDSEKKVYRNRKRSIFSLMAVLLTIAWMVAPCLAGGAVVAGTVTADNQLVGDDGEVYEVADTESGSKPYGFWRPVAPIT